MTVVINGNTGLSGTNGSAGTPAVQGEDTNTGIFFPAADTIAFAEGGAEVARFDSNGNLGLGTSSPGHRLSVYNNINGTPFTWGNATRNGYLYQDESGVGITDGANTAFTNGLYLHTANNFAAIYTNSTERARIDSSGNLLMGVTDPGTDYVRFASNGQTRNQLGLISLDNVANNGFVMFRTSNGTLIGGISRNGSTNAVLYATTSDYRLKESVADLSDGLSRVMALRPVSWVWKDCDGETGEGFIAHEVQDVVPAAVSGEKDAVEADGSIKAQGMDASYLVATLVKAIQEQQATITALTARVAQLEAQ